MTRYLISFEDGTMIISEEDLPEVADAAHQVVQEAKDAGVWVVGGGAPSQRASVVATNGTVTDGPYPETKAVIGGFTIIDVPSHDEVLQWAAKFAAVCRCTQEVREIMPTGHHHAAKASRSPGSQPSWTASVQMRPTVKPSTVLNRSRA